MDSAGYLYDTLLSTFDWVSEKFRKRQLSSREAPLLLVRRRLFELSQKRPSVLKNPFVPFSGPHSGAENPGFVVF
jgi:hypothetical protein